VNEKIEVNGEDRHPVYQDPEIRAAIEENLPA
jgi:glutathione peroxidase-family protein